MIEDWQRHELNNIRTETPVTQVMSAVRFVSRSAGRRKNRRPRLVTLIQYGGIWQSKFPWDVYATEILGDHADGDMLIAQVETILRQRGRF